ncbi:MAG: T9SS C-terminal target domain-containing protein [Chitinophagia bacterium]|nr:T9SS C-terminal target domain-containing protein [Chitinophagia bacterium]
MVVATGTLSSNHTAVNIATLPAGIYYVSLKGKGGNVVKMVVKE